MSNEMLPKSNSDFLDDFASVQIDPYITGVFEKIRLYSELLETEYISGNQINEIMNEIDDEWRQLMHKTVMITGAVSFMKEDSVDKNGEVTRDFYEDHEMEFGGVLPVHVDTLQTSDQYTEESFHKYKLELKLTRDGIDSDGMRVIMRGSADINDIAGIEFPDTMSVERAQRWLEYYMLDQMQDINVALFKPSKEECEMVMELRDIEIDGRIPHDDEDVYTLRTMQALNIYTNNLFTFDTDAPYDLVVSGTAWQPSPNGLMESAEISGSTMVAVDRIIWLAEQGAPNNIFKPHLATRFLGSTKDDPATEMFIPITSVESFTSYRYAYFSGYNASE